MSNQTTTVTRQRIRSRFGANWHYYATGPDTVKVGNRELPRRFDNSSLQTLRQVLRRAYGNVEIVRDF